MSKSSQPGPQTSDERFSCRALELARRGTGLASPNPCVGAVLVNADGKVIGEGFHTYDGVKHAEVIALEQAGEKARGAAVYVNLEPCSHQGRTGPCADALIRAGVSRVVASMQDPNPAVSGEGFARLRAAGIAVEVGVLESEARRLNESFAKYIRTGTPLVTLKSAMTLDGKIAAESFESTAKHRQEWITGEAARAHVHEMRHESDAILVGVGTVIADDPLLTDRSGLPRKRSLLRVVLDSHLRMPLDSRVVASASKDVVVLCSEAEEQRTNLLKDRGVRIEQIASSAADGHPDWSAVMKWLGRQQISSVMIEGGAIVNWSALAAGNVDKVFLYYAPKILGGMQSVPLANGLGFGSIASAAHVRDIRLHRFGEDFAVEGYLKDPYSG